MRLVTRQGRRYSSNSLAPVGERVEVRGLIRRSKHYKLNSSRTEAT